MTEAKTETVQERAFKAWSKALDEANEIYRDAIIDANIDAGNCPCGSHCCGNFECCAPCSSDVKPPMTYEQFLEQKADLRAAADRINEFYDRAVNAERSLASTQDFLRISRMENAHLQQLIGPKRPADYGQER